MVGAPDEKLESSTSGAEFFESVCFRQGWNPETVRVLYGEAPLDFRLSVRARLPFRVDLNGMSGITLFGRVWIHRPALDRSSTSLLVLLRHEAEHVAQQRESPILFYPRYLLHWLFGLLRSSRSSMNLSTLRRRFGRWHAAYRVIPDERRAYTAGYRFAGRLARARKITQDLS